LLINAVSGGLSCFHGVSAAEDVVYGEVVAVTGVMLGKDKSGWSNEDEGSDELQTFYVLTRNGDLISLTNQHTERDTKILMGVEEVSTIPKLPIELGGSRKRQLPILNVTDLESGPKRRILSLHHFGSFVGDETTVSSLPQLSDAFVRKFVGRHLQSQD
jgi:hypothetical protein